ncbi:MAG TPA: hypothetical protein VHU81_15135 [Thermoanaerobaculia bacterium]|jgi:hypothetical protein|nr:hypothetical protein [Thermoanaerobaculia bacterium]
MKKLIFAAFALATAIGAVELSTPAAQAISSCDTVRCIACPDGYHLKLTPPDCCKCVKD